VRRALLIGLLALLAAPAGGATRAKWDTKILTLIPKPGFPAHAYVHPNGRIYEGTYDNPSGDTMASRVFEIDGDGTMLRSWTVRGQNLAAAHGVQVATSDARGRLVLLDKDPPRVLLLNTRNGRQRTYATFPAGAVPNYAAWGPDGSLYVDDYEQAVLWKVPPRGGKPAEWLRDARLDGGPFGQTGLQLTADRKALLVATQSQAGLGAANPSTGRIWKVPLAKPADMKQFWESRPADGPDGFAIARSGNVYVACLVVNQICVVGPDGTEKERSPSNSLMDSPSSVQFIGKRVVVANQSYFTGDATKQAVLDVYVGEPGLRRLIPKNAGPKR
jgi:sugar lactone lactonase YvrE